MAAEEEPIKYVITTEGPQQAAEAFDRVADAMDRSSKTQLALTDAQNKSGQLARIAAYRQEAAAINAVGQSAQQAATAALMSQTNIGSLKTKTSEAATALATMSSAFSSIVPEAGAANTVLGNALRVLSPMLGLLGGGPGILAGGLIAAVTGLGAAFSMLQKSAKDAGKEAKDWTQEQLDSYDKLNSAIDKKQRLSTIEDEKVSRRAAIEKGTADSEQIRQELAIKNAQLEKAVADERAKLDASSLSAREKQFLQESGTLGVINSQSAALRKQIEILNQRAAAASKGDEYSAANARDKKELEAVLASAGASGTKARTFDFTTPEAPKTVAPRRRQTVDSFALEQENQTRIAKLRDLETQMNLQRMSVEDEAVRSRTQARLQALWDERDQQNQNFDDWRRGFEDQNAIEDQHFAQQQKYRQTINQGIVQSGAIVANVAAQSALAMARGQKVSLKAILGSIGEQMIAEGVRATFTGGIQLLTFQPQGAATIALGIAEIAAGAALAGASGGSRSGASGGASAPPAPPPPEQSPSRDTGSQQAGPTIVYVEFSSLVGPTAEDGIRVREAINRANNVYGSP